MNDRAVSVLSEYDFEVIRTWKGRGAILFETPEGIRILKEYTGFTEDEVRDLCERFSMDYAETESWYDGYRLMEFRHIYNPKSVSEAMRRHRFSNYWTSTETYEALKIYMDMDFDGLRFDIAQMIGGGWQEVMQILKVSEKLLEDTP